jgi:hypothetical protein
VHWGWREFATTGGGISYLWRAILENTIGSGGATSEERVLAFKQENAILLHLFVALKDVNEYPSITEMKEKLIECDSSDLEAGVALASCGAATHLAESGGSSYYPVGPGDYGAAAANGESVFGTPLANPSEWVPGTEFYESRSLKVASCLVFQGSLTHSELLESMGCPTTSAISQSSVKSNGTATVLSWTFGALFVTSLLGLANLLNVHVPQKFQTVTSRSDPTTKVDATGHARDLGATRHVESFDC